MATHFSCILPIESHAQEISAGCTVLESDESDTTEATEHSPVVRTLHFHWRRPESIPGQITRTT